MEKRLFHYQPEALSAEKTQSGRLKVVAAADCLSLLALGKENEILLLQAWSLAEKRPENHLYNSELPGLLADLEVLKLPFAEKTCAVSTGMITLVPNRLFFEAELNKYFRLLKPVQDDGAYFSESMQEFGFYVVWMEEPHFQPLNRQFAPKHLAPTLIRAFQARADARERSIFINVRGKQAQILVFDAGILLYFNSFDFVKPADLLYYVLLGYDQFKLDPEKVALHASGALLEQSDEYKMLIRYIRNIQFVAHAPGFSMPNGPESMPLHFWFDLLSL